MIWKKKKVVITSQPLKGNMDQANNQMIKS